MSKHKEAAEELYGVMLKHFGGGMPNIEAILRKYYDPAPKVELKKGDWVETEDGLLRFVIKVEDNNAETLELSGKKNGNLCECYKPHTFTEPDLALLNTDEVKYELIKIANSWGMSFSIKKLYKVKEGSYKRYDCYDGFPTVHEAIKAVFDTAVKVNHFDRGFLG